MRASSIIGLVIIMKESDMLVTDKECISKPYFKLITWLRNIIVSNNIVDTLTYTDAIKYFVNCKPDDTTIVKGSLYIESAPKYTLTIWSFLDVNNNVVHDNNNKPYGRRIFVKQLDEELKEAFGDNKLLIIE